MIVAFWIALYLVGWYVTARVMVRMEALGDIRGSSDPVGNAALTFVACWLWPLWALMGGAWLIGKHLVSVTGGAK